MTRETDQLLAVAKYYLARAGHILEEKRELGTLEIGTITRSHRTRSLSPGETALAHFASAAVRLATICEIVQYDPTENYRTKFYEGSGKRRTGWSPSKIRSEMTRKPGQHLHLLLRDNVAHEEPGVRNKKLMADDRSSVLKRTTIGTCNDALHKIAKTLKEVVSR
jgi:hypothetical protein